VLKVVSASATDTSVRLPPAPDAPPRLTLYTCTMPHSPSRIVVVAQAVIDGNTL